MINLKKKNEIRGRNLKRRDIGKKICSRIKLKKMKMHPLSLMSKGERKSVKQARVKKHEDIGNQLKEDSISTGGEIVLLSCHQCQMGRLLEVWFSLMSTLIKGH